MGNMKRNWIILTAAAIVVGAAGNVFAFPSLVTVDSYNDAGINYTDGVSAYLDAGEYKISVVRGAWNAWGYVNLPNQGWMWQMFIYQPSTSRRYSLGSYNPKTATPQEALNAHLGESLNLDVASGENIWFYIEDHNANDNVGAVTASIELIPEQNAVPEPSTMLLIGTGMIGAFGFIKRKK